MIVSPKMVENKSGEGEQRKRVTGIVTKKKENKYGEKQKDIIILNNV